MSTMPTPLHHRPTHSAAHPPRLLHAVLFHVCFLVACTAGMKIGLSLAKTRLSACSTCAHHNSRAV